MKPYGNFIKDYKINSYLESLEDKFTAEFNGLPEIKRIDELKTKSIIKMTRKAFMAHVGRGSHFNTVEEYLEILNDPDYVIYNQKSSYGRKVQFITKQRDNSSISLIVLFTDPLSRNHYIASGYTKRLT